MTASLTIAEAVALAHMPPPARKPRPSLRQAIIATGLRWTSCRCPLDAGMTDDELTGLGAGCTSPRWCCPRLDAVRRRMA